jgi:hypothetical protein
MRLLVPTAELFCSPARRDWNSPRIFRLVENNTWSRFRLDSITIGDGHRSRSSSNRGGRVEVGEVLADTPVLAEYTLTW